MDGKTIESEEEGEGKKGNKERGDVDENKCFKLASWNIAGLKKKIKTF